MKKGISAYLASIGSRGGKKSKRTLTPEQAREMQKKGLETRRAKGKQTKKKGEGR